MTKKILKSCDVHSHDFYSMFDNFLKLCMEGLLSTFGEITTSHLPWQILPLFSKPFKHTHSNEPFKLVQKEFSVQLLNPNIHSLISLHVFPSTLIWYPDGHSQWTLPTVLLQIAGEIQPSVFSVHSSISKVEIYFVKGVLKEELFKLWVNLSSNYVLRFCLTLSYRRSLSYRNQSIDLFCKSMDWFLYDWDIHHGIVKKEGFFDPFQAIVLFL